MTPLRGAHPALPLRAGPAFAQSRRCHSNGVGCLSDPWLASVCAAGARAQRARRLTQARSAQRQSASVGDSTEPASLGSGASRRHEVRASPSPAWLLAPQARQALACRAACAAGSPAHLARLAAADSDPTQREGLRAAPPDIIGSGVTPGAGRPAPHPPSTPCLARSAHGACLHPTRPQHS